jgi:hypothetical protein
MEFPIEKVETIIYTIRRQKVMLDRDLARLYGIETHRLNEAVKRNEERFPSDFLIIPSSSELSDLRSQIAISEGVSNRNLVFKNPPNLFTENGVAMLSSVLSSKTAIQINITIMRTFTKLRSFLAMENSIETRIGDLESGMSETHKLFKIVFERLDNTEEKLYSYIEAVTPKLPEKRNKIGIKPNAKS